MIQRGDIYLVNLNDQVGSEQGGIRPAVIVQNEIGNNFSPTTLICPLTTKKKSLSVTHVDLSKDSDGVAMDSTVLCEQIRVIDKSRIVKKLGQIDRDKLNDINKKILVSLGICN